MIHYLTDIPKEELDEFIRLIDGYQGIWDSDRSWINDENSNAYKITLYCYLISEGILFVENQKMKSFDSGYDRLIDFVEEFFKGKCIVNFTDMLFLDEINQAFCEGIWDNVHISWLAFRPEVLAELANRNYKLIRVEQAYQIMVENDESDFDDLYFLRIDSDRTTLIDFFGASILWKKKAFTIEDFRREFNLGTKVYIIHLITMEDFIGYMSDFLEVSDFSGLT